MRPIVINRVAWSVCWSVTLVCAAETVEAIEMPFALRTRVGQKNNTPDIAERFEPNTVLWACIPHNTAI